MGHDLMNREYVSAADLKPGDLVECDEGFTCLDSRALHIVQQREDGKLFIDCEEGAHVLEDLDADYCVGIYAPRTLQLTDRQLSLIQTAVEIAYADDDAPVYEDQPPAGARPRWVRWRRFSALRIR